MKICCHFDFSYDNKRSKLKVKIIKSNNSSNGGTERVAEENKSVGFTCCTSHGNIEKTSFFSALTVPIRY
jgi:hypothetical protein